MALAVKHIFASAFKGRTYESELFELMVKNGRHGNCSSNSSFLLNCCLLLIDIHYFSLFAYLEA